MLYVAERPEPLSELMTVDRQLHRSEPDLEQRLPLERRMGELLGYPPCCIQRYLEEYQLPQRIRPDLTNFSRLVLATFRRSQHHSYLLNHLVDRDRLHLIVHLPCSYDCPASRSQAARLLDYHRRVDPAYHRDLVEWLRRPVLLFHNLGRLFFDGRVRDQTLHYEAVHTLRPEEDGPLVAANEALLNRGNRIEIEDDGARVYRDSRSLGFLVLPDGSSHRGFPLLFGFDGDPADEASPR